MRKEHTGPKGADLQKTNVFPMMRAGKGCQARGAVCAEAEVVEGQGQEFRLSKGHLAPFHNHAADFTTVGKEVVETQLDGYPQRSVKT